MHIYVDADACPVVDIIEDKARKYKVSVTLLCDTNHVLSSAYSEVMLVGAGADAVDYKLISICHKGDIVVSGLWCGGNGTGKGSLCDSSIRKMVHK